ncbi:heterokaryon incompatibility protein-domain-containing protein [Massariosphaeria phaeospora]|uniref:Heterokaryon incompatibility protein-domain-containing protein n=1 Tax=Massariosphaeria phaeospora TaxID=100035 RepID=A0A7C8I3W4_9PLEO|nr:heterokaryon incompatibility protein-domain-containing protein [Massariosphaeria phaeospora]
MHMHMHMHKVTLHHKSFHALCHTPRALKLCFLKNLKTGAIAGKYTDSNISSTCPTSVLQDMIIHQTSNYSASANEGQAARWICGNAICCSACSYMLEWREEDYFDLKGLHSTFIEMVECAKTCVLCDYMARKFGLHHVESIKEQLEPTQYPSVYFHATVPYTGRPKEHLRSLQLCSGNRFYSLHRRYFLLYSSQGRAFNRSLWANTEPIDFSARVSTVTHWLSECQALHPKCAEASRFDDRTAARILEVHRVNQQNHIRLVPTDEIGLRDYIVLSHCWGKVPMDCKTTRENINDYQTSVDYACLPKTFQEAILITIALNIRHIWIDSLCVIQNSPDDWERESAKMASIFRNATLTISASSASNSQEGCGTSSVFDPAMHLRRDPRTPGPGPSLISLRFDHIEDARNDPATKALSRRGRPVNERAWIFQEKQLSRRILHTTPEEFSWQCSTHAETEDGTHHSYETSANDDSQAFPVLSSYNEDGHYLRYHMCKIWWDWVGDYVERKLTIPSDNYAALAGVIAFYQNKSSDEPLVGLWKRDLHIHLAWYAWETRGLWRPELTRRPSWSWMTYPHTHVTIQSTMGWEMCDLLDEPPTSPKHRRITHAVELLDHDIRWTGQPLTSAPSHGTLTLHGLLHQLPRPVLDYNGRSPERLNLDPDMQQTLQDRQVFTVMTLFAYTKRTIFDNNTNNTNDIIVAVYLIVEPTGRGEEEYRRAGTRTTISELFPRQETSYELPGTYQTITLV